MYFRISKKSFYLLIAGVCITLLMHAPYLFNPPYSQHVWRQTFTLSVATNLAEEGMNPFYPSVNNRFDGNGITGMHFPLYEWILAGLYQLFGEHYFLHRLLSLIFTIAGAAGIFYLTRQWFKKEEAGVLAFWFYLFSPELFYDGFMGLPDVLSLPLVIWGVVMYYRAKEKKGLGFVPAAILLALGGLVKLQYLGVAALIAGDFLLTIKQQTWRTFASYCALGLGAVVPPLWWYRRSGRMIQESGLADVGIELKPAESLEKAWSVFTRNIYSDLPETVLGWVAVIGLLVALFYLISQWRRGERPGLLVPIGIFGLVFFVYHLLELRVLEHHQYYMLPYIAVLIPVSAGAWNLLIGKQGWLLYSLIGLQALLAWTRMVPSRFSGPLMVEEELYQQESRKRLQSVLEPGSLVVTGPDESLCIYHYFLDSEGWTFRNVQELKTRVEIPHGKSMLADAVDRGAVYLITSDTLMHTDLLIAPYVGEELLREGTFRVYRLHVP